VTFQAFPIETLTVNVGTGGLSHDCSGLGPEPEVSIEGGRQAGARKSQLYQALHQQTEGVEGETRLIWPLGARPLDQAIENCKREMAKSGANKLRAKWVHMPLTFTTCSTVWSIFDAKRPHLASGRTDKGGQGKNRSRR